MNCNDIGRMILALRKEKNLTQKQLADLMNISDKTVSKWERGLGCPDVSLLNELSEILNVNVEKLLLGNLNENEMNGGNMKKIKFYVCPECGNLITQSGNGEISCCGRKLSSLCAKATDDKHNLNIENLDDEYYISFQHEMSKTHYVSFVSYVRCDRIFTVKLYPEQNGEFYMPKIRGGKFYFYCTNDGLFEQKL